MKPKKQDSKFYLYVIRHKASKCFYIGIDVINDGEPRIWKTYFTSSTLIQSLVRIDGVDAFHVVSVKKFDTYEKCHKAEQALICLNDIFNNRYALNRAFHKRGKLVKTNWPMSLYNGIEININPHSCLLGIMPDKFSSDVIKMKPSGVTKKVQSKLSYKKQSTLVNPTKKSETVYITKKDGSRVPVVHADKTTLSISP